MIDTTDYLETDLPSIGSLLKQHHGVSDIRYLLSDSTQVTLNQLRVFEQQTLTAAQWQLFQRYLHEYEQGKPLAYILGHTEFWGLQLKVNEHTLIPRPDTEILVEKTCSYIKSHVTNRQNLDILDLGTGSGAIAIALAHEYPTANITAVDFSLDALRVAQHNAATHQLNIQFIHSHWYTQVPQKRYHVIVSNPPYIASDDHHLDQLTHEPYTALVANENGLSDIHHIISHAPLYLHTNGVLLIEHGFDQHQSVQQLFKQHGFEQIQSHSDFGGNIRVTEGTWIAS